uniref:Uncharacterized protein n=1 Tax=Aceria tosichella TaxID=561515 RepID=A0A6G1SBP4_9ACAR
MISLPKFGSLARMDKSIVDIRCSTWATLFIFTSALLLGIAFITPYWLQSETLPSNQRFQKLGLFEVCFTRFHDHHYRYDRIIEGCKWIFDEDLSFLYDFLEQPFFISTQVLYTAGFLLLVLVCAGIVAVQQCFIIEREDYALRALSVASLLSAISCTSAVTIFAIYADRDDWMPDPEHNYLSWSFAAALIGSVLLWVSALLFYIEMRLTIVRDSV